MVTTSPNPSATTLVHSTCTWLIMKPLLSVGRVMARDCPPLLVHSRSITPSRISARPSVAVALIRGPRRDSAAPNTIP